MMPLHDLNMMGNKHGMMELNIPEEWGAPLYHVKGVKTQQVLVILFHFNCICGCTAGGAYG
jgi:hypothetical protein